MLSVRDYGNNQILMQIKKLLSAILLKLDTMLHAGVSYF